MNSACEEYWRPMQTSLSHCSWSLQQFCFGISTIDDDLKRFDIPFCSAGTRKVDSRRAAPAMRVAVTYFVLEFPSPSASQRGHQRHHQRQRQRGQTRLIHHQHQRQRGQTRLIHHQHQRQRGQTRLIHHQHQRGQTRLIRSTGSRIINSTGSDSIDPAELFRFQVCPSVAGSMR